MQHRGVEGRERRREGEERAGQVFYVKAMEGNGDKTVYYGARPGTARLTESSNSQVPILQSLYLERF